jgi:hypothetical protein
MAGALHFVHEPIPVSGGLDGDLAPFGELAEKVGVVFSNMLDPNRPGSGPSLVNGYKD